MGTHNRLLSLGPGRFLEVIAIDPGAAPPGRARWFELDTPAMQARLARGPALVTWVARTDDIDAAVATGAFGEPDVLSLARGDFRWRIGVPRDGSLALGGIAPTIIQWATHHPADVLADAGARLESLTLCHPEAGALLARLREAGFSSADPIVAAARLESHHLLAEVSTGQQGDQPRGRVVQTLDDRLAVAQLPGGEQAR